MTKPKIKAHGSARVAARAYAILTTYRGREDVLPGPLAQLAEHRTFNPGVVGSIPTRPTNLQREMPRWSSSKCPLLAVHYSIHAGLD